MSNDHSEETKQESSPLLATDQKKPKQQEDEEEEHVWYLAYGSNLHPKILTEKRKVHPKESLGCKVPSYKLVFDCPGIPYLEPCFASIAPISSSSSSSRTIATATTTTTTVENDDTTKEEEKEEKEEQCLHGVAHFITAEEFKMILRTEGGGGYEHLGYNTVKFNVTTYTGKVIECVTLLWDVSVNPRHQRNLTLKDVHPSKRYWTLLVEGSEHHRLDSKYQAWLKKIPYYDGPETLSQRCGRGVVYLTGMMFGVPVILMSLSFKLMGVYPPRWVYVGGRIVFNGMNYLHEYCLKWIFGNGLTNFGKK